MGGREYSAEFRHCAIELVRSERPVGEVVEDLGTQDPSGRIVDHTDEYLVSARPQGQPLMAVPVDVQHFPKVGPGLPVHRQAARPAVERPVHPPAPCP